MDLFKALKFLRRSWNDVKPETLANCFRKAGFLKNVEPVEPSLEEQIAELLGEEEQPAEGDDELNTLWAGLQALELVEGTLDEYLAVDDQLAMGGTRTLAEIAADVLTANVEEPEVDSDTKVMEIDKEPEQPPVTSREATAGFKVFQRYMEENFKNPALLQMCDKFDDLLAKESSRKMKQRNLFDYFVANP